MKKIALLSLTALTGLALVGCSSNDNSAENYSRGNRGGARMARPAPVKVFQMDDKNKDGKLSFEEFKTHHEKRLDKRTERRNKSKKINKMKKLTAKDVFKNMDKNNDGFVSVDEMRAHRQSRSTERFERRKTNRNK